MINSGQIATLFDVNQLVRSGARIVFITFGMQALSEDQPPMQKSNVERNSQFKGTLVRQVHTGAVSPFCEAINKIPEGLRFVGRSITGRWNLAKQNAFVLSVCMEPFYRIVINLLKNVVLRLAQGHIVDLQSKCNIDSFVSINASAYIRGSAGLSYIWGTRV